MPDAITSVLDAFYAVHREVHRALTAALTAGPGETGASAAAVAFALALGVLHAVTPGHGKAVLASYFFGREARPLAGIAAGLEIAGGHVLLASVLMLLFGSAVSVLGRPAGAAATIEVLAHAVIAATGAWLLFRALARLRTSAPASDEAGAGHPVPAAAALIPCPLTMLLLAYAMASASLAVAATLAVALEAGIALTLSLVATSAIVARRLCVAPLSASARWHAPALAALEILGAAAILAIGLSSLAAKPT